MIGIGIEVEVFPFRNSQTRGLTLDTRIWDDSYLLEKYGFEREYYVGMLEFSIFNEKKKKLNQLMKNVQFDIYAKFRQVIEENPEMIVPLKSLYFCKYGGIISNGVHVHVELPSQYYNSVFKDFYNKVLSAVVVDEKMRVSPSPRFLYSHHIWGRWRNSWFSFKRKKKFSPVYISKPTPMKPLTCEIRVFDVEDIVNRPEWVIKVIKKIIKLIMKPKNILSIPDEIINKFEMLCCNYSNEIIRDGSYSFNPIMKEFGSQYYKVINGQSFTSGPISDFDRILNKRLGEFGFTEIQNYIGG